MLRKIFIFLILTTVNLTFADFLVGVLIFEQPLDIKWIVNNILIALSGAVFWSVVNNIVEE